MELLNKQYIDIISNYDLFRDYLEYNLGISEETINFAFDTYGVNEETFENLVEWVWGDWEDFVRAIWKRIAKGKIKHIFECVKEERIETIKDDFRLF